MAVLFWHLLLFLAAFSAAMKDKKSTVLIESSSGLRVRLNDTQVVEPSEFVTDLDEERNMIKLPSVIVQSTHKTGMKRGWCFNDTAVMSDRPRISCLCHPSEIDKLPKITITRQKPLLPLILEPEDYLDEPFLHNF